MRTSRRRVIINATCVAFAFVAAACGGGGAKGRDASSPSSTTTSSPSSSTTVARATPPANEQYAAEAIVPHLDVFDRPNAVAPTRVLDNPWRVDPNLASSTVPQVFLVVARQPAGWVKVLLPVRPNGSTGWVRAGDVKLSAVPFHIRVELGAHRITVTEHNRTLYQGPVATGAPATPTPPGRYYIRVLLKAPNPNTVYGPYAYGLSSHSDALATFEGGDAEIGIHGNNDASVLGHDVTHGCIRMDNAAITNLAGTLPLGVPVDVVS